MSSSIILCFRGGFCRANCRLRLLPDGWTHFCASMLVIWYLRLRLAPLIHPRYATARGLSLDWDGLKPSCSAICTTWIAILSSRTTVHRRAFCISWWHSSSPLITRTLQMTYSWWLMRQLIICLVIHIVTLMNTARTQLVCFCFSSFGTGNGLCITRETARCLGCDSSLSWGQNIEENDVKQSCARKESEGRWLEALTGDELKLSIHRPQEI